ncbi:MAG TPA: Ig domain-containing protein [Jatrophihabitans sp.]|nr:Ig domain-containing protein [Jatrophihabitans sp.]
MSRARRAHSRFLPTARRQDDDGFVLLESIVSITLITVIMAALATLFITVIKVNNQQRARQSAVQVADTAVGGLRSLQPSDLVAGRTSSSVSTQWAAAPTSVQSWLASMQPASDTSVATPVLPATPTTQIVNNISYSTSVYLGWCWLDPSTSSGCAASGTASSVKYLRAVVAVTWQDSHCPPASSGDSTPTCVYVTSTLVSTAPDPVFNLNEAPPAVPIIVNPGSQTTYAVGDTVNLQLAVQNGTGVPTFTWVISAGSLPPGLAMNPAGLISGTITGTGGSFSTTVQVTDGFARNANSPATFSWSVLPPLTIADPSAQASVTGSPITPLTVSASGGAGAPYTWSDPGHTLPPGLSVSTVSNQARVTGTPTAPGSYQVTLVVKDMTNTRQDTTTFLWTVTYPPIALSKQSDQVDTIGQPSPGLTMSASGGDGTYTFSGGASLPTGLSLDSSTGSISGTATALGTSTVQITVTDNHGNTTSTSFNWSVVGKPTVTAPNPGTNSITSSVSLPVSASCPNAPCSYSISGQPTGLTINSAGTIIGTVGGSPRTYTGITVTITDADGASTTSTGFSWTVVAAPTVSSPGDQVDTTGATVSLQVPTSCADPACSYTLYNGPAGLSINSSGLISGKVTSAAGANFGSVTVTVRDSDGATASTTAFRWSITAPPTVASPGNLSSKVGSAVGVALTSTCPNAPCRYALTGGPAGVSIDLNGVLNGPVTGTANTSYPNAKIVVTDSDGISSAPTPAFTWTVGGNSSIGGTWPVSTTLNALPQQQIGYTCTNSGTRKCTITVSGLPSGVGISLTSGAAAANSSTSVQVSQGTGTVYLNGKVSNYASKTTYTVTVSINGSSSGTDSGSWVVA